MSEGYKYEATDEELKAAALLQDKGWRVDEPSCPICNGMGRYDKKMWWKEGEKEPTDEERWGKICPNGCPVPAMYF